MDNEWNVHTHQYAQNSLHKQNTSGSKPRLPGCAVRRLANVLKRPSRLLIYRYFSVIMELKCNRITHWAHSLFMTTQQDCNTQPNTKKLIIRKVIILSDKYILFSCKFAYSNCEAHSLARTYTRRKATRYY